MNRPMQNGSDRFMSKMGKHGLHPFVDGFRSVGIQKMSQLQSKSISQINEIAAKINMPPAAVDRLLGILKKTPSGNSTKSVKKKKKKKPAAERPKKIAEQIPSNETLSTEKQEGKATDSSYYHFSSTPKEAARQFDAVKVESSSQVQWQTAAGSSSWNPGNTVEERDFSDHAQRILTGHLEEFNFGNGIIVKKVSSVTGDFSLIANRGKIKTIYDLAFNCEWQGKAGDKKVAGTLKCSDIMPDEDTDDWFIESSCPKKSAEARQMKAYVESQLPRLKEECVDLTVVEIRSRVQT